MLWLALVGSFVMTGLSLVAVVLASREVAVFGPPWRGWRVSAAAGLAASGALALWAALLGPVA